MPSTKPIFQTVASRGSTGASGKPPGGHAVEEAVALAHNTRSLVVVPMVATGGLSGCCVLPTEPRVLLEQSVARA